MGRPSCVADVILHANKSFWASVLELNRQSLIGPPECDRQKTESWRWCRRQLGLVWPPRGVWQRYRPSEVQYPVLPTSKLERKNPFGWEAKRPQGTSTSPVGCRETDVTWMTENLHRERQTGGSTSYLPSFASALKNVFYGLFTGWTGEINPKNLGDVPSAGCQYVV